MISSQKTSAAPAEGTGFLYHYIEVVSLTHPRYGVLPSNYSRTALFWSLLESPVCAVIMLQHYNTDPHSDYLSSFRSSMSGMDPRPFKCPRPNCGMTFKREEHQVSKSRLSSFAVAELNPPQISHMLTHYGHKKYACDEPDCVARFAQKDELRRHQRLAHISASSRYEVITHHLFNVVYSRNTQGALADTDQVVYNSHDRRPSDPYESKSSRSRCVPDSDTFAHRMLKHRQPDIHSRKPPWHSSWNVQWGENNVARTAHDINEPTPLVLLCAAAPPASTE